MSQFEKAKERLLFCPKDYTYSEASTLLNKLGFVEMNKGKTSGSRVRFYRQSDEKMIDFHKPHPNPEMDIAAVKMLKDFLENIGEL